MNEWKVHQTLISLLGTLGLPADRIAYEQREFKPPTDGGIWYALHNLPAARDPVTLGNDGEDRYVGVFQIDVYGGQGLGVRPVLEAASVITTAFTAGTKHVYGGQAVLIRKSEIQPAPPDSVRSAVSVSVYWSASLPR